MPTNTWFSYVPDVLVLIGRLADANTVLVAWMLLKMLTKRRDQLGDVGGAVILAAALRRDGLDEIRIKSVARAADNRNAVRDDGLHAGIGAHVDVAEEARELVGPIVLVGLRYICVGIRDLRGIAAVRGQTARSAAPSPFGEPLASRMM